MKPASSALVALTLALFARSARAEPPAAPSPPVTCAELEPLVGSCVEPIPPPPDPPPFFEPAPLELPPTRSQPIPAPRRSRGAYVTGIALISSGGGLMGVSAMVLAVDAMIQNSWWSGCYRGASAGCSDHQGRVIVGGLGMLTGVALLGTGLGLFSYGRSPVPNAPPPVVVTATGAGATLRVSF